MAKNKAARRCNDAPKVSSTSSRTPKLYHESDWERANRLLPVAFGICFALMCIWEVVCSWM